MDQVAIRVATEKHFGFEVSDSQWYSFDNLQAVFKYFTASPKSVITTAPAKVINLERTHEIRMPQMSNCGLSENWLFKEIGDIHWSLLSVGLGQKSSLMEDGAGNRLYATFIRIRLSTNPLNHYSENDSLMLTGEIKRNGSNTYFSNIQGESGGNRIEANLMTSFTLREADDNTQISKSTPIENNNQIGQLNKIPEFFNEYRLLKKGLKEELDHNGRIFPITSEIISEASHTINPFYEVNGLGLLYFSCYPIISDSSLRRYLSEKVGAEYANFHTVYRDVFYFSNCNASDTVVAELNFVEVSDRRITTATSLKRLSDGRLMARIFTSKVKA